MMEFIKVFGSLLMLTVSAHAWGKGSTDPVDCGVTSWGRWSKPFFGGVITRERAILRTPAHGGAPCPELIDINFNSTTNSQTRTTKEIATAVTEKFISRGAKALAASQTTVRDLLVIIDASGSISNTNFKMAVKQIAELLGYMCPEDMPFDKNFHKLAVLRYSSGVTEIFDFNKYKTTFTALNAVKNIPRVGQTTNTAEAFRRAIKMFTASKGARVSDPNVVQEVLILTDGRSDNGTASIQAAKALKSTATVFGLIIGSFSNQGKNEVLNYVSYPAQDHLFNLPNFNELKKLVQHVKASLPTHKCAPFDLS